MTKTVKFTNENFKSEVLDSEKPVLVDFWAQWCGPCKMVAPMLDDVANEMSDKIIVGKVDVDKSMEVATKYNIRGIPALLLFKNGKVVDTKVGAMSKTQLDNFLKTHIS